MDSNLHSETHTAQPEKDILLLIVEDDDLVRLGLRLIMNSMPGMHVVAEADNGRTAIEKTLEFQPDVVLLDIGLPVMSGMEVLSELKSKSAKTRVIMLTSHDSQEMIAAALKAGADGYCSKNIAKEDLRTAILSVFSGESWLDPALTNSPAFRTET